MTIERSRFFASDLPGGKNNNQDLVPKQPLDPKEDYSMLPTSNSLVGRNLSRRTLLRAAASLVKFHGILIPPLVRPSYRIIDSPGRAVPQTSIATLSESRTPDTTDSLEDRRRLGKEREMRDELASVMGWHPTQIASSPGQIHGVTMAYIGELKPDLFKILPRGVKRVFPSWNICKWGTAREGYVEYDNGWAPDNVKTVDIRIGGKTPAEMLETLKNGGWKATFYAKDMVENPRFKTLNVPLNLTLVRVSGTALGFDRGIGKKEFLDQARMLGLKLCPPEVGPNYLLQLTDPKEHDVYRGAFNIAMKSIKDRFGNPSTFFICHEGEIGDPLGPLVLDSMNTRDLSVIHADAEFIFVRDNSPRTK